MSIDMSSNLFVVTTQYAPIQPLQRLQYNFTDHAGILVGAVAVEVGSEGAATFLWSENGMWIAHTAGNTWSYSGTFFWFMYADALLYGYDYGGFYSPMWLQAGILVAPWISQVASAELVNGVSSNATVTSIQPATAVLGDVGICYDCSASPLPTCFPIAWPMQQRNIQGPIVNDSALWFLRLTPSPSGQCPYYLTFSFGSITVGVNITITHNYTLEVTLFANEYQPQQTVYSGSYSSFGVISTDPLFAMWGLCITLSTANSVALQFPCLSSYGTTLTFFAHNVSIPLVEQNTPLPTLSVIPGSNVSDINILSFPPSWSLSSLCGWFSTTGSPQYLQWSLGSTQVTMFSFHYDLGDNPDTCATPDGIKLISTACNSSALVVSMTSQQIVVTYGVVNQLTPIQQLTFPSYFTAGLVNITISGPSINIFTTPPQTFGSSKVYSGMLENMHDCVAYANAVTLMGPSCSSLEVYATQGFYIPSHSCDDGVSKQWTYATLGFACTTAAGLVGVVVFLVLYLKMRHHPERRPLLSGAN
jgi:hypothetical protein